MDYQTNLRYTFLREKYKNIGGCKKCKRYKCLLTYVHTCILPGTIRYIFLSCRRRDEVDLGFAPFGFLAFQL